MKIISRYIIREHIGPLTFALTALTSLMLLNFISRQFGELVGKGLPWSAIGEFFMLSIPFTIALTVPMSVLVAVLYAYSRLAAENEVTALKANGVSPWRLVAPAIVGGVVMTIALLAFNDQVLPRANHRLKTLQESISQTKPTLMLKEQVINAIAEGKFYLKAGHIDQSNGRMKEIVIYDLADPMRRRTIYAETGRISFTPGMVDLDLDLYNGEMQEVSTDKPGQLDRLFYKRDRIRIRNVGNTFRPGLSDPDSKGDREMSICEMQKRLWASQTSLVQAQREMEQSKKPGDVQTAFGTPTKIAEPRGIGWAYCVLLHQVHRLTAVKEMEAAELPLQEPVRHQPVQGSPQDTSKKPQDTTKKKPAPSAPTVMTFEGGQLVGAPPAGQLKPVPGAIQTPVPAPAPPPAGAPPVYAVPGQTTNLGAVPATPTPAPDTGSKTQEDIAARAAAEAMRGAAIVGGGIADGNALVNSRVMEATLHLQIAQRTRDRYLIEIHKKFSLAAACLIFCIVAPPIALRFPRGGVGLVIGVSLVVFALYYVGLIGGESAANHGYVAPFWAMWGTNVIMTLVGVVLLFRLGRDTSTGRGGGIREWLDERAFRREERRAAALAARAA